jgi:tRNA pseudouridine-54 N-methylase
MSLTDLRSIAAWHRQQADACERDAALCAGDVDALCRARNQAYFHADAARKLSELADAFTSFEPQQKAS